MNNTWLIRGGTVCTPAHPIGACMVSSEGACAAELRYAPRRQEN